MTQLQRLQKDSIEIKNHAEQLIKEGDIELAKKVEAKAEYLENHIAALKAS